jgi:hypothetical protein
MSILKYLILSTLLFVPMISGASTTTITTLYDTGDANNNYIAEYVLFGRIIAAGESFIDLYNFNLNGLSDITTTASSSASQVKGKTTFTNLLSNLTFTLDGLDIFKTATSTNQNQSFAFDFTNISSGSHQLKVQGENNGTKKGGYTGDISVIAAVPLPAGVWLMLSGLIGVLSLTSRKSAVA